MLVSEFLCATLEWFEWSSDMVSLGGSEDTGGLRGTYPGLMPEEG